MAWENRPGGRYYYRKKRIGKRVISEYMGGGDYAELTAEQDEIARQRAAEEQASFMAEVKAAKELEDLAAEAERETMTLVKAVILASGYHKHHGQWRRQGDRRERTNDKRTGKAD